MNLREFLAWSNDQAQLTTIARPVDPRLEMARVIHALECRPLLFTNPLSSQVLARAAHRSHAQKTELTSVDHLAEDREEKS